jgi:hypothetical protein
MVWAANNGAINIGLDSTTVAASETIATRYNTGSNATEAASYRANVAAGRHRLVWLEAAGAASTMTFTADSGMTGMVMA